MITNRRTQNIILAAFILIANLALAYLLPLEYGTARAQYIESVRAGALLIAAIPAAAFLFAGMKWLFKWKE